MHAATLPRTDEMYRAVLERDSSYAGVFVVAVKTTGIFCRPTCPAKKPRRENVEFFSDASAALHAGYRACKRCDPMGAGDGPEWVQTLLERVDRQPEKRLTEGDLRAMQIDPARARRYFTRHFGMTFHAYHRARRLGLALSEVRGGRDATSVGYRNGYNSASGFRDAFAKAFGTPPGSGSARDLRQMFARWLDTPLGPMLAIADDEGVRLLEFVDRRGLPRELEVMRARLRCAITPAHGPGKHAVLDTLADELRQYFEGALTKFRTPIAPFGSAFQLNVWQRLCEIPFGETKSYGQIAEAVGRSGSSRAIGTTNGLNRIAILIPCHRVVRSDGSLSGYGGGVWRKKWLLEHERNHAR